MPIDQLAMNATGTTVLNTLVIGGPLLICIAVIVFIAIFISIPFIYRRVIRIFGWLGMTFVYFLKGLAGLLSLTLIYIALKGGAENATSILTVLKWIGIAIICYAAIASAGYMLTYAWKKLWRLSGNDKFQKRPKGERKK